MISVCTQPPPPPYSPPSFQTAELLDRFHESWHQRNDGEVHASAVIFYFREISNNNMADARYYMTRGTSASCNNARGPHLTKYATLYVRRRKRSTN